MIHTFSLAWRAWERAASNQVKVREAAVENFWIDSHDVTNAQFARFVAETGYVTISERTPAVVPDAQAMAPRPPSRLATRSSSTETVGLVRRE